jgi:type IV pilus assembly protein PilV
MLRSKGKRLKTAATPRYAQAGVMLLEALIGMLIFSVGILAVVGMQAMAVRAVAESKYRTDAGFLANQIIGQMWVDRANLATYVYAGSGTPPVAIQNWVTRVGNTLPGTTANRPTIAIDAANTVTITISWQHPEEANLTPPPAPHQYRVVTSINCC